MKLSFLAPLLLIVAFAVALPKTGMASLILLEDDFNDNSLDPGKWNVVTAGIPQNPKSAIEQNQQLELQGRAHLNTASTFDPDVLTATYGGALVITGEWEFVSNDDFFQVLTRTDGVPAGSFGETANGLEFYYSSIGASSQLDIRNRGSNISIGSEVKTGSLQADPGDTLRFEIKDWGTEGLFFSMSEVGNPANQASVFAVLTNDTLAPSLISFHNREGGRRSNLDNVVISVIPEPSSGLILYGFLTLTGLRRCRRKLAPPN